MLPCPRHRSLLAAAAVFVAAACAEQAPSSPETDAAVTPTPVMPNFSLAATNAVQVGHTIQLTPSASVKSASTASGLAIKWTSSNTSIATVSTTGVVTAKSVGTAKILDYVYTTAVDTTPVVVKSTEVVIASVKLTAPTTSLSIGKSVQLVATCYDATGYVVPNRPLTWTTSSASIANVSSSGLVTPVANGSVTITATSGSGVSGKVTLTVGTTTTSVASVVVSLAPSSVSAGASSQATATAKDASGNVITGQSVSWTSSNAAIASVSGTTSSGTVSALAAGSATISAKVGGATGTATMTVTTTTSTTGSMSLVLPALPQATVSTAMPAVTGKTIAVHAGDNLQAALNNANRGDQIVIDAGATFNGQFVLPAKPGTAANGWITIRSSAMSSLPPQGTRVNPAVHASAMPKIVTSGYLAVNPAIYTAPSASGYRLIGLEVTVIPTLTYVQYGLVNLGDGSSAQNSASLVPTDLVLDRMYIHGQPSVTGQRCVGLQSARTAIVDSYISECHAWNIDSQAIGSWNGPGPYLIDNNWLEASGENVMFGGADPHITNQLPADITITRNYFFKPLTWKGKWTVKNLFELKFGKRILVEGNVFENCWVDGQTGFAVTWKSTNQGGSAPWSETSDVTFRYNIIRNSAAGIALAAHPETYPAVPASRVSIENNLFEKVGYNNGTSNGRAIMLLNQLHDVQIKSNTIVHNTFSGTGQFILMDNTGGTAGRNLLVRDNIATWGGPYGAVMGNAPQGSQALAAFMSPYAFDHNVVVGIPSNLLFYYPSGNSYASLLSTVSFVNPSLSDYHLSALSPYRGLSSTGGDPGVDMNTLLSKTQNATLP